MNEGSPAGRNGPCPCGSGKKYKKCCLNTNPSHSLPASPSAEQLVREGIGFHQSGNLAAAGDRYRQALEHSPRQPDALHLLGVLAYQAQDYPTAIRLIQEAITAFRPNRDFLFNLGNAYKDSRRFTDAIETYRKIDAISPADPAVLNNLGLALRGAGRPDEAASCLERAIAASPRDPDLWNNLGLVLTDTGRIEEAISRFRHALELDADVAETWNNLGSALVDLGHLEEGLSMLDRALTIRPDYEEAHSNKIFCLDFVAGDPRGQQQERKEWYRRHIEGKIFPCTHFRNTADPERKLRIGYVSADFRRHSAAYCFGPLLLDFDRDRFDVFCYSNSAVEDDLTRRFKNSVSGWRDILGVTDAAATNLIQDDGIDILVDLAGHSRGNRLHLMAHRPAPIQASGWGHANGTGLATVDYLFSDSIYIPPEEAGWYAEKLLYLPCAIAYQCPKDAPPVAARPCLRNGFLTFGCFSRLAKVSPLALDAWCALLRELPESRILFKAAELNGAARRDELTHLLAQRGIASKRVSYLGHTSWHEHMTAHGEVDVMLDPFPHGGGVSVLESLWMGVPMLATRLPMPAGRVAASVLTAVGRAEWVAAGPETFVDTALARVNDATGLAALSDLLREQVATSPLGNPAHYVGAVETHYQAIWRRWCNAHT